MDTIWSINSYWLGRDYCKKSSFRKVFQYIILNYSLKSSKPFRISKNGVVVNVIEKINEIPININPNVMHLNVRHGHHDENQNGEAQNNILEIILI